MGNLDNKFLSLTTNFFSVFESLFFLTLSLKSDDTLLEESRSRTGDGSGSRILFFFKGPVFSLKWRHGCIIRPVSGPWGYSTLVCPFENSSWFMDSLILDVTATTGFYSLPPGCLGGLSSWGSKIPLKVLHVQTIMRLLMPQMGSPAMSYNESTFGSDQ